MTYMTLTTAPQPDTADAAKVLARANLKSFIRAITSPLESIAFGSLDRYGVGALYGKPYGRITLPFKFPIPTPVVHKYRAAKDTWNLLRKRGINALVNHSLLGIVSTT
ncbi:hypothetical protein QFC20_004276 [Naganishia adeliensis]|uniref:Uncharacterized protein n=1 Tax=Naganishia adeliensis TaxID=92952 RepID=A0ACC2W231_9TREE|nr:hypothetical protein QFC20_004276 [Naganishia adeliensis]